MLLADERGRSSALQQGPNCARLAARTMSERPPNHRKELARKARTAHGFRKPRTPAAAAANKGLRATDDHSRDHCAKGAAARLARRAAYGVARELRRRIESGVYRYGDWLPSERALLLEFPISRTVLREAMIILECMGLIESHRRAGNRVLGLAPMIREAMAGSIDPIAFLEACRLFEVVSSALACCEDRRDAPLTLPLGEGGKALEGCRRFHIGLAEASDNRVISTSVKSLWSLAMPRSHIGLRLGCALSRSSAPFVAMRGRVVEAVNSADPERVRGRMRDLFDAYFDALFDLEEQERLSEARRDCSNQRRNWEHRRSREPKD